MGSLKADCPVFMREHIVKTVPIPELTAKNPTDRLIELYRKVGWDGKKTLNPSKVKIIGDDFQCLLEAERKNAKAVHPELSESDINFGINMLWLNTGPSGNGKTFGMVELCEGWVSE